jgi:error-prone DNA polymerase
MSSASPAAAPASAKPIAAPTSTSLPGYAELHCRSNFSFLVGASHPEELVARAAALGYSAIAITDECSVAGVVRAHEEVKRLQAQGITIQLLLGASFEVQAKTHHEAHHDALQEAHRAEPAPACRLVMLARNREGWGDLCERITQARLRSEKGSYRIGVEDFEQPHFASSGSSLGTPPSNICLDTPPGLPNNVFLLIPRAEDSADTLIQQALWARRTFTHVAIAAERLLHGDDAERMAQVRAAAHASGLPIVAAGDVLMHRRSRKAVQDTLTAIRLRLPIHDCGLALAPNAEQHLRSRLRLGEIYPPAWLATSERLAQLCHFSLQELRYEYPSELVPEGLTPTQHLRALTQAGARERYPDGTPASVLQQIEREFELIQALQYEAFFLTVHDVVRFARGQGILCQGRGSAANSAVCYCLGITEVDPTQTTLLFERFISKERNEPPDIDVDFEHERREEVIQYIYNKYGVQRTALAAALATYRTRSVVRDVGKALSMEPSQIDSVARSVHWFDDAQRLPQSLQEAGLQADAPVVRQWMELVRTLKGFPRHLSQHVGGFVIARDKLSRLVPIENAAMPNRRVIQWDKDDLESLGLLKVDVLALGMLTTIRRTLALMSTWHGRPWRLQDIPREDPATYDMACRADTVGVFQIESRAQMSMLPRLKPRCLYDLVIQVAIVRPGPIQGGMVHPYLQRREQRRAGTLPPSPYPALDVALGRTLGVPIFQEQVMQVCMIAAGFTPGEADGLRRAMAAWRRDGQVDQFETRIKDGMRAQGYDDAFADAIFKQICGFGEYGFPESHAFSFALLAYVSAWMKCHEPAAFLAALLNSQPMGFYAPAQLTQDARRHGVVVLPVDVTRSDWDCTLEAPAASTATTQGFVDGTAAAWVSTPCVRLGLRLAGNLTQPAAQRIVQARQPRPFDSVDDLARRAAVDTRDLQALARADALQALAGHRRAQLWVAAGQAPAETRAGAAHLLRDAPITEQPHEQPSLFEASEGEAVVLDYAATGLTLRRHPLALLRPQLATQGWSSAEQLAHKRDRTAVRACGIVTMRQQPETAKGVIFVTLEDETGCVNVIVWRRVREAQRHALLRSKLLGVAGEWQYSEEGVTHLIAKRLFDLTPWLGALSTASRDFH